MARTWTLEDTETIIDNPIGGRGGSLVVNDDYDIVYYHDDTRVYSWDGTTQTDISSTYFTTGGSSPYAVFGLCFFAGDLYACHWNRAATGDNEAIEVSRWDGGTTWTAVRSPVVNDAAGEAIVPAASVYDYTPFSCDGSRMSVTAGRGIVANYAVNSTVDGTSWTVDTVGTAYDVPMSEFSGLETQSRHGQIVGMKTGAARGLYLYSGGDWVKQYAYGADRIVLGSDDDYIYLRDTGSAPYDIYQTDDYGENETTLSTAHTPIPYYIYPVGSDAIMLRRSGTNEAATLTAGDFVADGSIGGSGLRIGGFFRLNTTMYALMNSPASTTIYFYSGGTVTPFATGPDQLRHVGISADQENIYLTAIQGGTQQFIYYNQETLASQGTSSFGAVDYADPDTLTAGLWPVVKPGNDNVVYVYGRDGNDVQIHYNDLNGTLGWQDIGPGTATWGTAKFMGAAMIDPLAADDLVVAFSDDDIYTTPEGTANWVKLGDITEGVRAAGRHPVRDNEILFAGTAAGSAYWSPNWGVSDTAAGGTALGTIHWIEVSR